MKEESERLWEDPLWKKGLILIRLRWGALAASALLFIFAGMLGSIFSVGAGPMGLVTLILGSSNLVFHLAHAFLHRGERSEKRLQMYVLLFFAEVLSDYLCVTIIIYYFGFMHLNLAFLYLPHVILTAIIFERRRDSFGVLVLGQLLVYMLTFVHSEEMTRWESMSLPTGVVVPPRLVFIMFNAGIFVFLAFLANILVADVVKRKNALLETTRRLIEIDREKQNYTLRATHELKAPFAAIQSYTNIILDGYLGEISPKMREVVIKMKLRCDSLSKMIRNIIQLSNLRTTIFKPEDFKPTEMAALVRQRIDQLAVRSEEKSISVELVNGLPPGHMVNVIPNLTEIMFGNLIGNAIEYSNPKSSVTVTIAPSYDGRQLEFSVKDHGIGIPRGKLPRIFEDHFRCENAVDINPSGNGMGLAIVGEVVRLHRGKIFVDSEEDSGSTFTVVIPMPRSSMVPLPPGEPEPPSEDG